MFYPCRKNARLADDEVDASDIAAIRSAALYLLFCKSWRALISSVKHIHCLYDSYSHCRDDFVTGDPNFKQDIDTVKSKAEQQGTAQPELRDAAKEIKKVVSPNSFHKDLACCGTRGFRTQREAACVLQVIISGHASMHRFLTRIVPLRRTLQASTQRQRQTVPLEIGTERHVSGPEP